MRMTNRTGRMNPAFGAGLGLLAGLILVAAAAPPAAPKIGIVDSKRIAAESKVIREMINKAATKAEHLKGDLEKNKADLTARLEAYSRQKSVISGEEKGRREEAIDNLKDDVEVLEIRLNREVKRSQEGMVGPMGMRILAVVREIAAESGLTVVFASEDVVHYDAASDITQKVIDRLDKK